MQLQRACRPQYPPPTISVFEQSKHNWVQIDDAVKRFQQNSAASGQPTSKPAGLITRNQP
jgi:hypothetical protein